MPKAKFDVIPKLGQEYGRPDIERLGLFIEMPYLLGKKYVSPFPKPPKAGGRNLIGEGSKIKDGTQAGYFDKEYKRLFEGEAIPWKKSKESKAKRISPPFLPTGEGKLHSTPGDYYGCFGGNITALGTGYKAKKHGKFEKQLPNMKIGATKMGNCGYADICINKYPEHLADPIFKKGKKLVPPKGPAFVPCHFPQPCFTPNPFGHPDGKVEATYQRPKPTKDLRRGIWIPNGPAKWEGGCKGGTFTPFPEHMACPYVPITDFYKPKKRKGDNFYPQSTARKTFWNFSTIDHNTDIRVTRDNYKTYEPSFVKYLVN